VKTLIGNVDKRCVEIGEYIRDTGATVRRAAAVFGISKSTVHIDVTKRLRDIDKLLYDDVKKVLEENKAQRHIRGGIATREKYSKMKKR
jgi:putative DeoR family transcriptional regulator (stage III sporulation protein D)